MLEYFAFMPPMQTATLSPIGGATCPTTLGNAASSASASASAAEGLGLRHFSSLRSSGAFRRVHPTTLPSFLLFLAGGAAVYQLDQALKRLNE